jgi:hypothetical protein
MPPYSAQNELYTTEDVYAFPSLKKTDESVDISPPAPALTLTPSTDSHDSSVLEQLLCGGGGASLVPTNPFKHRTCAECGGACSKFQGYRKELVPTTMAAATATLFDEDESIGGGATPEKTTMKKQYYHKRCYQVKHDRDAHKVTSGLVTVVLPEFMEYLRRQEEEKTRVARQAEEEATAELERLAALLRDEHTTTPSKTRTKQHVLRASLRKRSKKMQQYVKNGFSRKKTKTKPPQPVVVWQEYTDPASGNPYWSSDGVITTWDKPTTGRILRTD